MNNLAWRRSSRSGPNGGNCVEVALDWRRSSRSGQTGGQCVEVATCPHHTAIRDSKDPNGPHLTVPSDEFTAFLADLATGAMLHR